MSSELIFNIYIEVDTYGFTAHCLEMGLTARDNTYEKCLEKINKITETHFEFALKNNRLADVYMPSSNDVWSRFLKNRTFGQWYQKALKINDSLANKE